MSAAERHRAIESCLRELARQEGFELTEGGMQRDPLEDSYAFRMRMRFNPISFITRVDSAAVDDAGVSHVFDLLAKEVEASTAVARGDAVIQLLDKRVTIDNTRREALCDRLTALVMRLAKKDPTLCEVLALKLMAHVERVPR